MIAKLKGWLIAAGSVLLVVLSLGTWAVWERKAKQFEQRRADRAEKLAKARHDLLDVADESKKRRRKINEGEKAVLEEINERIKKAKERRRKALKKAQNPHTTPWEWLNKRFGKQK
jgi:F0F1-type ATP synthase membrane subunit b/b'